MPVIYGKINRTTPNSESFIYWYLGVSIKVTYTVTLLTTVTKLITAVTAFNQTNIRIVSLSCLFYIKIVIFIHINP